MSENKHTPEPCRTDLGSGSDVINAADEIIAMCCSNDVARRFVDCINACVGVEDPSMYPMVKMLKLADEQRAACFKLEKQRDELLAAYRQTNFLGQFCLSEDDCIASRLDFSAYERGVIDAIKAVEKVFASTIASLKGGAA